MMERYTYDFPHPDMPQQIRCEKCNNVLFREVRHRRASWRKKERLVTKCVRCRARLELPCGIVRFDLVDTRRDCDSWTLMYNAFWLD